MASSFRLNYLQNGIRWSSLFSQSAEGCFPGQILSARYLSRMRTKTGNKGGYWIRKLAPPLYDRTAIEKKLEERPESRFEKVAPPIVSHTGSVFFDPLLDRFTNMLMFEGKRYLAEEQVRICFQIIKRTQLKKYHSSDDSTKPNIVIDPLKIFHKAVDNCKPVLRLSPLKRGGVTYQIPMAISDRQAEWTSMKWLVLAGRDHEQTVHLREVLARELIAASNNEGRVIKRKFDLHKQCEANKAYAHYRWSR